MDAPHQDQLLTWLIYLVPIILVLTHYMSKRRRRMREDHDALQESLASGMAEPPSLHPVIDPARCIGSGGCARACPEGALGIVNGRAELINGAACIGHGACFHGCPVGAISLVFGTERRGVDIPHVNSNFETNVPGVFIAGELGGMGLIRKAAEQGKQAIASVRGALKGRSGPSDELDVMIVGAGPAGIAAGLGAVDAKLAYRLVEQEDSLGGAVYHYPRNKIAMTAPVTLPIIGKVKFGEVSKEELLTFWNGVIEKTGLTIHYRERMEAISKTGNSFKVKTSVGEYAARTVVLAIGRRGTPRKLGVPGEELPKVVYRLIDAEQYRDMRVMVIGGGDSALEAATTIADQPGAKVTLSYRGDAFSRVKEKNRQRVAAAEEKGNLKVLLSSNIVEITDHKVKLRRDSQTIDVRNDAVIVCAGGELPTGLLKNVGISFETKRGTA